MRIQALIESNYLAKFNIHVVNSFQRNNRKALKPLLQNLAGHSGSLIPEDPPRIRRALVQATADPGTLARASTSEGAEARRPPRLSSRPERSDNSPTCSATEADRLAEPTGLLREAGAPGGRGWCRAPGSAPPPLSNRPRRRAGWEKRRRPASWLRWGTRAAGGGCWGGCGATPALPEGSGGLDKPVSERGLGLPRAPGAAVCRGREAQQQRRPRRGGQRPHLAPAGGAELGGPTGAPAVGRNRDPKRVSPEPDHPAPVEARARNWEPRALRIGSDCGLVVIPERNLGLRTPPESSLHARSSPLLSTPPAAGTVLPDPRRPGHFRRARGREGGSGARRRRKPPDPSSGRAALRCGIAAVGTPAAVLWVRQRGQDSPSSRAGMPQSEPVCPPARSRPLRVRKPLDRAQRPAERRAWG
ncbi:WAS/WASL-interacting protein family member 1-like [Equus przewalskii]|uniref:WAS/WASL-interacting protein family member 1-like n=1 Tax=Equus przewalskii TaxID=9798 RepID=A0ABM4KD34_EQUPR